MSVREGGRECEVVCDCEGGRESVSGGREGRESEWERERKAREGMREGGRGGGAGRGGAARGGEEGRKRGREVAHADGRRRGWGLEGGGAEGGSARHLVGRHQTLLRELEF